MVSRVLYRPFEETDFDAIASVLQGIWHDRSDIEAYNFLEACDDLAYSLSNSTFSQVVVVDDAPSGIVLARAANAETDRSGRWEQTDRDFLEQMRRMDPRASQVRARFSELEDSVNAELLRRASLGEAAGEITLLAVGAETRGTGIGSVLLDAALSYLSSHGTTCAYLFTDTSCTWSFYEHRGFTRLGRHRSTREERHLLPHELYLYGLDLSA